MALNNTEQSSDSLISESDSPISVCDILEKIPDGKLRGELSSLIRLVIDYAVPDVGDGDVDVVLRICMNTRRAFAYLERHQTRFGLSSAAKIRPEVVKLFRYTLNKLEWINRRETQDENLKLVYESIRDRLDQISSGQPIRRV